MGLLLGLTLGLSQLKKIEVIFLTLSYSLIIVPWQIISILDKQLFAITRIGNASNRLFFAFRQLFERQPVDDYLLFITLMVIIFWSTGLYAGYILIRYQKIVAALFPSTFILLVIQYYDQTRESPFWSIGIYFFFVLLLLGHLNYLEDKKRWQKENVFTDSGIGFDISVITFSAIAIIILLAWTIPSSRAEWTSFRNWWQNTTDSFTNTKKHLGNALAFIEEKPVDDSGDLYKSRMILSERPYQNNQVLFTVRVLESFARLPK